MVLTSTYNFQTKSIITDRWRTFYSATIGKFKETVERLAVINWVVDVKKIN